MKRRHSTLVEGQRHTWDVERLWELAAELEPFELAVDDTDVLDVDCWFAPFTVPSPREVMRHAARAREADLSFPVILGADGRVMDGAHRLARAAGEGRSTVLAVQFAVDPAPDQVEPWPPSVAAPVVEAQVAAWNRGDLEGYLEHCHERLTTLSSSGGKVGKEAVRSGFLGGSMAQLEAVVESEEHFGGVVVALVRFRHGEQEGKALLTFVREGERWLLAADAVV